MNTTPTRPTDRPEPATRAALRSWRVAAPLALASGLVASAATLGVTRLAGPFGADGAAFPPAEPVAPNARAAGRGGSGETAEPGGANDPGGLGDAVTTADIAELRDALATAEAERSQLAGTLLALNRRSETLEARVAELGARVDDAALAAGRIDGGNGEGSGGAGDGAAFLPSGASGEAIVAGADAPADGGDTGAGDRDSLIAAGLDPQGAEDIDRRRDEFQLARLELFDQAAREGWLDSERFTESLDALAANEPDLRTELGDDGYDRYLYEEGVDNRVGIDSVINGSAASLAGLQPGDVVTSYAGERVFGLRELQSATREGARGEQVQLSVLRDGQIVVIDVPRGPLGVTLNGRRLAP